MGAYIPGLRWVRNRHSHQLPITTAKDTTPFFGRPGDGYVLHISAGYVWRPYGEIPTHPRHDGGAKAYRTLVAGQSSVMPLARACHWLQRHTGLDLDWTSP